MIEEYGKRMERMATEELIVKQAEYPRAQHPMSSKEMKELLKSSHKSRFETVNHHWGESLWKRSNTKVLDIAFKVDFLFQNKPEAPFWGIDVTLHPDYGPRPKEHWRDFEKKENGIWALKQKGIYDALNIEKMCIILLIPPKEGFIFIDKDTRMGEIVSDIDGVFASLDDSEEFLTIKELDARE